MPSKYRWLASALLAGLPAAWPQGSPRSGNPLDTLPPVPARPADIRTQVPQAEPRPAIPADQPVTPAKFEIEGVKAIPFDEVAARFATLAGKPTTVGALVAAVEEANALYKQAGFALSFFYLPQQDFAGGVVRIAAVEGYVGKINIEGDAGTATAEQVRAIAYNLMEEKPLTQASFERYTGILAQLPGVAVQASVPAPTTTEGDAVMTLTLKRKPYAVSVGGEVGEPHPRAVVTGEVNDLITPGSRISVSVLPVAPGKDRYYGAAYQQHIGKEGLILKLSVSYYKSDPNAALGIDPGPLDRESLNRRADLTVSYPLILSATRSLVLSGGAYGVNNADTLRNPATGATLTDDVRSRAVFAQLAYAEVKGNVERSASAMVVQGINAAGARGELTSNVPGLSGPDGIDLRFTRVLLQAAQAVRFSNQVGLAASVVAQYSGNTLPPSERISFGGTRFGRGYAPGQTSGDSGYGLSLEINRRFAFGGGRMVLEPYLMAEAAQVKAKAGAPVPDHLVSVTAGARLSDQHHYTVDLGVSKPVGDTPLENPGKKVRTNLLISYRLGDP